MSKANDPTDLGPLEARLAELLPRAAHVDRDEVLFEAGRQAARSESRRALRKWQGACGVLLCLAIVPWVRLTDGTTPGGELNASSQPVEEPETPLTPPSETAPVLVQDTSPSIAPKNSPEAKNESPSAPLANSQPASPWYQLFPKFGTGDPSLALHRPLAIGSSREGTLSIPNVAPQTGVLSSSEEPPLTTLRRDWSPD